MKPLQRCMALGATSLVSAACLGGAAGQALAQDAQVPEPAAAPTDVPAQAESPAVAPVAPAPAAPAASSTEPAPLPASPEVPGANVVVAAPPPTNGGEPTAQVPVAPVAPDAAPPGRGLAAEPRAKHAIYAEGTTMLLLNAVGLAYSYRPYRALALSGGLGASAIVFGGVVPTFGGQAMVHGLFGPDGAHSFEVAGGVSSFFVFERNREPLWLGSPAAFLGYRYHPLDESVLVRTGVAWNYGFGFGVNVSLGYAF
jgi:hypothetical protein